jgi:hypothetical protein
VTVEERITEALTDHQRQTGGCLCGWNRLGRSHPAHQASVVAGIVREAQAEAWESCADGYVDQLANITLDWEELSNPYQGNGS